MRLGLYYHKHVPDMDLVCYHICVCDESGKPTGISAADRASLRQLAPDIERMCHRILGDDFHSLSDETKTSGILKLAVTKGTTTGDRRFDFLALGGWIELHNYI